MRKSTFVLIYIAFALSLSAQTDTTIWNVITKVETNDYVLSIPEKWEYKPSVDASSKDRRFEFTGVSLPREVNHTPLVATFQIRKMECNDIKEASEYVLNEFALYPDRITPPGHSYDTDSLVIASGEKAKLYFTHYFRRTKASNYTRYDMVVYSTKRKAAYMLTALFQYRDSTYAIEETHKFRDYMVRVFRALKLR